MDEEQVAEVFVRINSEGVTLNQADFILTLMSVFWEKGRASSSRSSPGLQGTHRSSAASPFNWYIQPQPAQLLRVTVALAFRRAVLKHVYSLLRGKDLETGKPIRPSGATSSSTAPAGPGHVLDLTQLARVPPVPGAGGFRGAKMISSENAILFSYALWLIGRVDYGVPLGPAPRGHRPLVLHGPHDRPVLRLFRDPLRAGLGPARRTSRRGDADGFVAVLDQDRSMTP